MSEDLDCLLGNLVSNDFLKHMIDMIKTTPKVTVLVRLNLKIKLSEAFSYYNNDKSIAGMVTSSISPSVHHGADREALP